MAGYFDASDEASEICRRLLVNIKNAQSNYLSMDSFLASISDSAAAADAGADATTSLKPFAARSNPFNAATRSNFRRIHDRHSSILHAIKSSHGKVARKLRLARAVRRSRTGSLLRLQEQLDTAAKGTYVLGRDLDTVSHLVARLSDGIERENAMARCCAERFPVQEMVNQLSRSYSRWRKLAEELEEHVCLCLATIQRARVLVITEISKQA
ncbi:UPF0496 protein 3-like [Oryza brachyantha]|uniref:UPF0496 protein 3-like n=1 Tax=Oryza brachyantha TaxID=4533 RepID=UPI001ADBB42B|nr:UPF0496 protein 3-like [Oryza brachyantha]